jgi:hypothetical protein
VNQQSRADRQHRRHRDLGEHEHALQALAPERAEARHRRRVAVAERIQWLQTVPLEQGKQPRQHAGG